MAQGAVPLYPGAAAGFGDCRAAPALRPEAGQGGERARRGAAGVRVPDGRNGEAAQRAGAMGMFLL